MISGIVTILFGLFALALSTFFAVQVRSDPSWINVLFLGLFGICGVLWIWSGIVWCRRKPQSALRVTSDSLHVGMKRYSFRDVLHLSCQSWVIQKRLNLATSGTDYRVIAAIETPDGTIRFRTGRGPSTWMSGTYGRSDSEELLKKINALDRCTFPYRAARAVQQLEQEGSWTYDGCEIDQSGIVHIKRRAIPISEFRWKESEPCHLQAGNASISLAKDKSVFLFLAKSRFAMVWEGLLG